MKKLTAILMSAALLTPALASPALAKVSAPANHGKEVSKAAHKSFKKGDKFDRRYASHYTVVDYRKYKKLKAPPKGYHYVRSGNDILLVGITSGIVASVLTGMING